MSSEELGGVMGANPIFLPKGVTVGKGYGKR
jgi:hypothetical protein